MESFFELYVNFFGRIAARIGTPTRFLDFWRSRPRWRRTTLGLALWLAAACLLLIFPDRGYPRAVVFDETYYIPMAQKYIHGVFYQEEHPPLARLLIALGQKLTYPDAPSNEVLYVETIKGDWPQNVDMSGYRLFPAIFGTFLAPLVYLILLVMLEREGAAFLGGLLTLFDNALLTQSRFALPESFLLTFILTTMLIFIILWKSRNDLSRAAIAWWALWGVSFAAALGVKLTALFLGGWVAVYFFALLRRAAWRHAMRFVVIFGMTFAVVTVLIWQTHFLLLTTLNPDNTYDVSERHLGILRGEVTVSALERFAVQFSDAISYTFATHGRVPPLRLGAVDEIGSPWYQWPFGGKAISYRWETPDGETYRTIYLLGNPLTWLASLLGVVMGSALVLTHTFYGYYTSPHRQWVYLLVGLYWAYMGGMMTIERVMYLYHYLPPMLIGVLLAVIIFVDLPTLTRAVRRGLVTVVLLLLLAGFVTYMPYTYYLPLTREQITQRNIWPAWQLTIGGAPIEPPP